MDDYETLISYPSTKIHQKILTITTFHPLTKLRPYKNNWRVQVKCLHSWRQNTPFGDTFEMGNKIHACFKRTHMYHVQHVIGRVHDLGNVQTVKAQGEDRKRVEFRLVNDQGNDLACCFSGAYAGQIEAFIDECKDQTIVCLLRFAKVSFFRADLLELAPVEKSNGKKHGKRIQYDLDEAEIKPISEVVDTIQVEICKIICTIKAVDTDWTWFYFGCNRHSKHVNKIPKVDYERMRKIGKPMFHYEICKSNVTNVSSKFKLHMVVKDDTQTCNLMLLGSVAQSIIGYTAENLWDGSYGEIEDPYLLPKPISDLVGKSFCFGLSISSDNVTNGSDTFLVLEVCSGDKVISIETNSEAISYSRTTSETMSSAGVLMLDSSSSEDPKTPALKRKDVDPDLADLTSTSKKLCTIQINRKRQTQIVLKRL
ncbi:hypothetical protein N665_0263s0038 [Sinapis alba]|nr:hypothetical protein N665_0263s0038 [Sinapis alba]